MKEKIKMNKWVECKRIYDEHFVNQALKRSYNKEITDEILINGIKEAESDKEGDSQDYKVSGNGWAIKVTLGPCTLTCWTVFKV